MLADVIELAGSEDPDAPPDLAEEPFDSLLLPFVTWARTAARQLAGGTHLRMSRSAHAAMEQHLLRTLVARAGPTLALEFSLALRAAGDPLDFLVAERTDVGYRVFVRDLRAGDGLLDLLVEYSVLGRVLVGITERWVDATVELLHRLDCDAGAVGELTGDGPGLLVVDADPGVSDPHRGRRTVVVLSTSSGARVVYKPRSLRSEAAWSSLLRWLDMNDAPPVPSPIAIVDRGEYGWAEFVDYVPCAGTTEARAHYHGAGALLALVHVLRGVDCHADNVIPTAQGPVLVDTETLMAPEPSIPADRARRVHVRRGRIRGSVLATYLLPAHDVQIPGETPFDGSGLGAQAEAEHALPALAWIDVNTDRMRLAVVDRSGAPRRSARPPWTAGRCTLRTSRTR